MRYTENYKGFFCYLKETHTGLAHFQKLGKDTLNLPSNTGMTCYISDVEDGSWKRMIDLGVTLDPKLVKKIERLADKKLRLECEKGELK